jgi:hypothetical protein
LNQQLVSPPCDLDGIGRNADRAWRGEYDALTWDENGFEAYGRPALSLRECGNDAEAVALDGIIDDARHVPQVDGTTFDRPQPIRTGLGDSGQDERDREDVTIYGH